jgi:hypothetical protein
MFNMHVVAVFPTSRLPRNQELDKLKAMMYPP